MVTLGTRLVDHRRQRGPSGALLGVCAIGVLLLVVAVVGLVVDPQRITGAPAWLKPAKFAISISLYCATVAWLLSLIGGHRRAVQVIAFLTTLGFLGEFALIDLQVLRGTTSHFNTATPFDSAVYSAMGGLIVLVFVAAIIAAVLLGRQRSLTGPVRAAVVGGLVVAIIGMAEAVLMFVNTDFGDGGAHTVGAPDGGPGIPVTGWSTQHGDLRVAHFVGIHALQVLPIVLWLLARFRPALTDPQRTRLMVVASAWYAGMVVLLAWQAERGQSVLRPDVLTMTAVLGWSAVAVIVALVAVRSIRRVTT